MPCLAHALRSLTSLGRHAANKRLPAYWTLHRHVEAAGSDRCSQPNSSSSSISTLGITVSPMLLARADEVIEELLALLRHAGGPRAFSFYGVLTQPAGRTT